MCLPIYQCTAHFGFILLASRAVISQLNMAGFDNSLRISRRDTIAMLAAATGVVGGLPRASAAQPIGTANGTHSSARLKQSFCRWPYARTPLPEICSRAKDIGFSGIDLLYPDEWPAARDAGLTVS